MREIKAQFDAATNSGFIGRKARQTAALAPLAAAAPQVSRSTRAPLAQSSPTSSLRRTQGSRCGPRSEHPGWAGPSQRIRTCPAHSPPPAAVSTNSRQQLRASVTLASGPVASRTGSEPDSSRACTTGSFATQRRGELVGRTPNPRRGLRGMARGVHIGSMPCRQ